MENWWQTGKDREGRDLVLFGILLALLGMGLVILYPASSIISSIIRDDPSYFVRKQLVWALVGLFGLFVSATFPLKPMQRFAPAILAIHIFFLVLVFIPGVGHSVSSSRESFHRWLNLGFFTLQPSEFAKVAMMIYVSRILSRHGELEREFHFRRLVIPSIFLGLALALIVLEPQYGTTVCILTALVITVYVSGFPIIRLVSLFLAMIPIILLIGFLGEYRLDRFRVWLDPYAFRHEGGYQLVTAFRAFQEGGVFGTDLSSGFGHRFLTYGHTDFILALLAEDYGWLGVLVLLGLFVGFLWRSGLLLRKVDDPFAFLLGTSSLLMLLSQTLLNMAVVTGLLPTTGVSLPFVSYGGSSLIASLLFGGLIINATAIHPHHHPVSGRMADWKEDLK